MTSTTLQPKKVCLKYYRTESMLLYRSDVLRTYSLQGSRNLVCALRGGLYERRFGSICTYGTCS